jgi:cell division protein ZapA
VSVSEVYIYGSKYKIRSDEDKEYIEQVASYVTERMKHLEESMKVMTTSKLATMVAFSIADELFRLKKDTALNVEILNRLEEKLNTITT